MKKEIGIGFLVGLIASVFGLIIAIQVFGESDDYLQVIKQSITEGFFGKLISIGALLNLGAFFIFIKKKQDHRAKGVLIATIIIMLLTFATKLL